MALRYVTFKGKGKVLEDDVTVCSRKIMVTEPWEQIAQNGLELPVGEGTLKGEGRSKKLLEDKHSGT